MKKKLICLLISSTLAVSLLAGCASKSSDSSEKKESSKPKNVTLKMAWWGNQTRTDRTLQVLKLFQDKNPGVKFESEYYAWADYWTKMSAEIAGGSAPDIMQQDFSYINQYNDKGLLVDLTPYTKNGKINVSDVDKSTLAGGTINNKMIALSMGSNCMTIAYDPDLFQKAGVPEPTAKWTWTDYENAVQTIHSKLGIFGDDNAPFGNLNGLRDYLRQQGQNLFTSDQKKLGYSDDKYFVDFFNREMKLYKAGALPTSAQRLEIKTPEQALIVSGKAAMAETNSNQVVAMGAAAKKTLKLAQFPSDPKQAKNGQFIKPSQFISIMKDCKDKDTAAQVVDFFTNNIDANKVLAGERGVPISSKVRDALKPTLDATNKNIFDFVDQVGKVASPIDPPDPASFGQIQAAMDNLEQQMLYGKMSVEDAAKAFRSQANSLLAQ